MHRRVELPTFTRQARRRRRTRGDEVHRGTEGFMPKAPGSATVAATVQELSGSIQVIVEP